MVTPEKEEKVEIKHTIEAQQTQKSEEISGQQEHSCLELTKPVFLLCYRPQCRPLSLQL